MTRSLTLLLALTVLIGCAAPQQQTQVALAPNVAAESRLIGDARGALLQPGDVAPDFRYTLGGAQLTLGALRGKKVLLNFWATWCGPCKAELPELNRVATRHSDTVVVAVNRLETLEQVAAFASATPLGFTLVANPDGDIAERYAAKNIPTTYLIDPDGTIGAIHIGQLDGPAIDQLLETSP